MSLRFIIGPSGSGKTTFLIKEMMAKALDNPKEKFFYIVPDQFTMEMQKAMVLASPGKAIMNIEVLSFGRLSHRIFEELGEGDERMLDDTGKNLIIQKLALANRDKLQILGKKVESPAVIHEVKSAISEFMQYSVGEEKIDELIKVAKAEKRNALAMKLADIKLLYVLFNEEISGRFTTVEGRMGLLKKNIQRSALFPNSTIVFDGFTGFTPIQLEVITELLCYAKEVTFSFVGEKDFIEAPLVPQELFALSKRSIAAIRKCAKEAEINEKETVYFENTYRFKNQELKSLERSLFRRREKSKNDGAIKLYSCKNSREEVKYLGRKILSLVRKEGYSYRDIAVICGDIGTYSDDISREFEKRNIPCFIDSPIELTVNPIVQFIKTAISVWESDFISSETVGYLRSGFCPMDEDDIDFLEDFIIRRGIRGHARWNAKFFGRNPEKGVDEFNKAEELREIFMKSIGALDNKKHSVLEFVSMLEKLLDDNDFENRLTKKAELLAENGNTKKADEFSQVYGYIREVFGVMKELSDTSLVTLKIFGELFNATLIEIKIGTIPRLADRVLVGDLERTRLSEIRALFFIGVNEGSIPKGTNKGGIISDLDRQFLNDAASDIELAPNPRELMYRQRLYLYMNVTKPSNRLYVSYVVSDISGKEILPSYFIETLKGYFENLKVEVENNPPEEYMDASDGFALLAKGLRDFAKGFEPKDGERPEVLAALFEMCSKDEKLSALLYSMINGAFYQVVSSPLSQETVDGLYKGTLRSSISKLQVFASCPYQYFLKYGLGLKDNPNAEVTPMSGGSMLHKILEKYGKWMARENLNWHEVSNEERERILLEIVEEVKNDPEFEAYTISGKNRYLGSYVARTAKKSVEVISKQLSVGEFIPEVFEKRFESKSRLDNGYEMVLTEVIDRIDVYEDENGEKFIKIVDYKTGNEDFSAIDTAIGTKLQLPVYMKRALEDAGKAVPGAMFYYHAADPMVEVDSGEIDELEISGKVLTKLTPRGLVNNSQNVIEALDKDIIASDELVNSKQKHTYLPPDDNWISADEMLKICDYSFALCKDLANQIVKGNIAQSPYEDTSSAKNHCGYCPYQSECRANPVSGENLRKKPAVKDVADLLTYIDESKEEK